MRTTPDPLPPFLAACCRQPASHTPIWIMRQAGRYLPEYRKLREKVDFLTLTKTPDLAAEVTLQPIRRFGMDAAILFSDIMTPLEGMGLELEFAPGPVIGNPVRSAAEVDVLTGIEPEESVPFVLETIRILSTELPSSAPSSVSPGRRSPFSATSSRGPGRRLSVRPRPFSSPSRQPPSAFWKSSLM